MFNTSDTRGTQRSYGLNYQKLGKELMSMDELAVMDGGKCILQLRGVHPFLSDKYINVKIFLHDSANISMYNLANYFY